MVFRFMFSLVLGLMCTNMALAVDKGMFQMLNDDHIIKPKKKSQNDKEVYNRALKQTKAEGRILVVWVGMDRPANMSNTSDTLHITSADFDESTRPCVVIGVHYLGRFVRGDLGPNASLDDIRAIAQHLRQALDSEQQQQYSSPPARPFPVQFFQNMRSGGGGC
jgi:hypothetical protein